MKRKVALLCFFAMVALLLSSCEPIDKQADIKTTYTESAMDENSSINLEFLQQDNIQYIEIDYLLGAQWIQKLSDISPNYNLEEIVSVFSPKTKLEKGKIPVFKSIDGICFYPGDSSTKTSAYLFDGYEEEVSYAVQLLLYDFDQERLTDAINSNDSQNNSGLEQEIKTKNTSGRVTEGNYESLYTMLINLYYTDPNSSAEALEELFGILPKDISDTQQKKFAYYLWNGATIVFYDLPFSYCEAIAPGGSIKILLNEGGP